MGQAAISLARPKGNYLQHALAATLGVIVLPGALVYSWLAVVHPDPPLLITAAVSIVVSTLASTLGARLWMHSSASSEVSFGDLMIWQWWRRERAKKVLVETVETLEGPSGQAAPSSLEDQLRQLRRVNTALEAKDPYTLGHSKRVRLHAYRTGVAMRLSIQELEDLRLAAELHDVGKMMLSDRIIRKPEALDEHEWAAMKRHSAVGAQMVEGLGNPRIVEAIRSHHERFDGKGYPDGISGENIPLLARIIAVADTFDAITSTRSYRQKENIDKALAVIKAESGSQFDPRVVDAFMSSLPGRSPVASLAATLLPGLGNMIRQAAFVGKRVGVASLLSATAAGASVSITASAVRPPFELPESHKSATGTEKSEAGKQRAEDRSGGKAFSGRYMEALEEHWAGGRTGNAQQRAAARRQAAAKRRDSGPGKGDTRRSDRAPSHVGPSTSPGKAPADAGSKAPDNAGSKAPDNAGSTKGGSNATDDPGKSPANAGSKAPDDPGKAPAGAGKD